MEISAETIVDKLRGEFTFTVVGQPDAHPVLSSLLLVEPQTTWDDDQIYLVEDSTDLISPSRRLKSLVLITGTAPLEFVECFDAALFFGEGTSFIQLHNYVQEVFAENNLWEAEIHRILTSGSDVQAILDISAPQFGNPLIL